MPKVLAIAGSPNHASRSSLLLAHTIELLQGHRWQITRLGLDDFPADDLIYARFGSPAVQYLHQSLLSCDALIVSTPVYKASFSGGLKAILDLLPERALAGKAALALTTGGSPAHTLAVDQAIRPVFQALKARHILSGVYATDEEVRWQEKLPPYIAPEVDARLRIAVVNLLSVLPAPGVPLDPYALRETIRQGRVSI
jgi:FMN reductase